MPRENDGNFKRLNNRNYELDDANSAEFNGKILNDDIEDLRVGIEDCIDGKGRGKVQADIDFGGKRITNLGNAIYLGDGVSLKYIFQSLTTGQPLRDNGSNEEQAEVKLIIDLDIKFKKGFTFSFVAPFTQTEANIKANKRREIFTLKSLTDEITVPVLRETPTFEKEGNLTNDNLPSFLKGDTYSYFIDEYDFKDGKGKQLCVRWKDPYGFPTAQMLLGNYWKKSFPNDAKYVDYPITPAGFYMVGEDNYNPASEAYWHHEMSFISILAWLYNKYASTKGVNEYYNTPRVFMRY